MTMILQQPSPQQLHHFQQQQQVQEQFHRQQQQLHRQQQQQQTNAHTASQSHSHSHMQYPTSQQFAAAEPSLYAPSHSHSHPHAAAAPPAHTSTTGTHAHAHAHALHGPAVPLPHRTASTAGVPAAALPHHFNSTSLPQSTSYPLPLLDPQQQLPLQVQTAVVETMSDQQNSYVPPPQDPLTVDDESHKDKSPLVSERISTTFITNEYAKSDPVYQTKTAALPQKFHQYRTTRRDGHCGWRAITFCYFETLQALGNVNKCNEEYARIQSLRNLLLSTGQLPYVFEDWEEQTLLLLNQIRDAPADDNGAILRELFNDFGESMCIITYMKLLTSAWVRTHPDDFQPYIQSDIDEYCKLNIEAAECEVDNISLNALTELLLKPAGITLKVMYLDRSPGSEINEHRFDALDASFNPIVNAPIITLLYRPGHYDILYRIEDAQQQPAPIPHVPQTVPMQSNVYVGLASASDSYVPEARPVPEVYSMLPGVVPPSFNAPQWAPSPFDIVETSPVSPVPSQQMVPVSAYAQPPPTPITPTMQQHPQAHGLPMMQLAELQQQNRLQMARHGPFRPSRFAFEAFLGAGVSQSMPCQTSVFQNSPHNTSHFLNPHFQPEEWDPSTLYVTPSNRARNRC